MLVMIERAEANSDEANKAGKAKLSRELHCLFSSDDKKQTKYAIATPKGLIGPFLFNSGIACEISRGSRAQ